MDKTKYEGFLNAKHFIWIVPMLLVVGFIIGYVSGLNIPKEITFAVEPKTLQALGQVSNNTLELGKIQSLNRQNNLTSIIEDNCKQYYFDGTEYVTGDCRVMVDVAGKLRCVDYFKDTHIYVCAVNLEGGRNSSHR